MRLHPSILAASIASAASCAPATTTATLDPPSMTSTVWRFVVRVAQTEGSAASRSHRPAPAAPEAGEDEPVVETSPALAYDRVDDWDDFWEEVYEAERARPDVADEPVASADETATVTQEGSLGGGGAAVVPVAGVDGAGGAAMTPLEGGGAAVATSETAEADPALADEDELVAQMTDLEAQAAALEEQLADAEAARVQEAEARRQQRATLRSNAALSLYTALMIRRMQLAQLARLLAARRGGGAPAPAFGGVPQGAPAQQPFQSPPTPGPSTFE